MELLLSPNGDYSDGKKIQYIFGLRVFPLFFHIVKKFSVQRNPILYLGLDLHFRGRGLKIGNKEASRTYTIGFRYLVPVMAERQKDFIFPPILTLEVARIFLRFMYIAANFFASCLGPN